MKGSTKKSSHLPIVLLTVVAAIVSIVAIIVTATKGLPAGLKVEEGVVQVDQLEVGKVSYTGKDGKAGRVLTYTSANGVEFQDLPSYVAGVVPGSGTGSAGSVPLKSGTTDSLVRYQEGGSLGEAKVSVNPAGDVIFQGSKYQNAGLFLKTGLDGSIEAVSPPTTNVVSGNTAVLLAMTSEGATLKQKNATDYPLTTNLLNPNSVVGIPSQILPAKYLKNGHILTYKFAGRVTPVALHSIFFRVPGLGEKVGFRVPLTVDTIKFLNKDYIEKWCFDMTITVADPGTFLVSSTWSIGGQTGCTSEKVIDQKNVSDNVVDFSPHAHYEAVNNDFSKSLDCQIVAEQGYVELRGVMSNYKDY